MVDSIFWCQTWPVNASFHFILWRTETKDKGLIQFRSEILFLDCIYVEREKAMKWYHPKRKWKWIRFLSTTAQRSFYLGLRRTHIVIFCQVHHCEELLPDTGNHAFTHLPGHDHASDDGHGDHDYYHDGDDHNGLQHHFSDDIWSLL